MSDDLTPTAKAILGFLRSRPRSGYEIKRAVEISTQFFWGASFGQIYPELRRLAEAGLVEIESQGARRRKAYRLTPAGQDALDEWLQAEGGLFQYRDEGLLRLFFSDFADPESALVNVRRMREWREHVVGFFRTAIEPEAREDAQTGYLYSLRALQFGIAMLEGQARWLADLERELEGTE
jgi:DNA-binding PadR family transcriptional regulator